HRDWKDHYTNTQGRLVLDFISSHALENHNKGTYTCFKHNGQSIIDLTLSNSLASSLITNWRVGEQNSDSDHELISFSIDLKPPSPHEYFVSTWKFIENDKTNWSTFFLLLDTSTLQRLPDNP